MITKNYASPADVAAGLVTQEYLIWSMQYDALYHEYKLSEAEVVTIIGEQPQIWQDWLYDNADSQDYDATLAGFEAGYGRW